MKRTHTLILAILCVTLQAGESDPAPLVLHEWGTFTVLQDDQGNPIKGVNINEESLPEFVHELESHLTPDSHELAPLIGTGYFTRQKARLQRSKGIARYYHAALMRMETPIIYVYPPADQEIRPIDIEVDFNGGWITEWYPNAKVDAPGYKVRNQKLMGNLKPDTVGRIGWHGVEITPEKAVPKTDFPVWLAPRATEASILSTSEGESEHYLFYRGVANLESPLKAVREGDKLNLMINPDSTCPIDDFSSLKMWLVQVDTEGQLEYRTLQTTGKKPGKEGHIASTDRDFDATPGKGYEALRAEMLTTLVAEGLYKDEAIAMLNTWKVSYFLTEGLRVFYTLPQEWTERVLPLRAKGYEKTETVRSMIGRIELMSPYQQQQIMEIANGSISTREWFMKWHTDNGGRQNKKIKELAEGRIDLNDLGLTPPKDYQAYMNMGRFRDALMAHEIASPRVKDPQLQQLQLFARNYDLPTR